MDESRVLREEFGAVEKRSSREDVSMSLERLWIPEVFVSRE